jgi:taurine dioxygenase
MTIEIRTLSDALGAEVLNVDLRDELGDAIVSELVSAWRAHLVLLFRDQHLSEEDQIRFARHFGALQERPRPKSMRADLHVNKYPDITMLISNIRHDGQLIGSLPDGEVNFHSDMCFVEKPPAGAFLYSIETPSNGGDTVFINMHAAYDALAQQIKDEIDDKKAVNVYLYGAATREGHVPDFNVNPHHTHPVVVSHPKTGRDILFVNRLMTWHIEGLDEEESTALLETLLRHIEQPRFMYAHKWRPGDLLFWDNCAVQHARTDFDGQERRLLRRVVIQGEYVPSNRRHS